MPGTDHHDVEEATDAALVVMISRYRHEALAEVYRRHGGAMFALGRRFLAERADTEEVIQEVFLRLWEHPELFDASRGSLRTFLLAQCHGRSVDRMRSETARRRREERDVRGAATAGFDLERQVWALSAAEHVRDAVAELTATERDAIMLAYFGGHTYREVARLLDEPEGTIKTRIRSGLRRLHDALEARGLTGTVLP